MAVKCPESDCKLPKREWILGETYTCQQCSVKLIVVKYDPVKLVVKPPPRDDSPKGDLRADHGGTYTLQELIADIIDNSIDATPPGGTVDVEVDFGLCDYSEEPKDWDGLNGPQRPYITITDNAKGMNQETLSRAMGKGHMKDRDPWELGHYGVGLKKSSLSNAYEVTVFTKESEGEVLISRYSSCYIERFDDNAVINKSEIEEIFPWMTQTDAWETSENEINAKESGTVVLLEGIPTLQKSAGEHVVASDALNEQIEETNAALGLIFHKYLHDGGATIEYKDPDTGESKSITKKLNLEVDGDDVEPIDPFLSDLIDPDDNFSTLCKNHQIRTDIDEEKHFIDVNIYIIPNDQHPQFKARSKEVMDSLKLSRKSAEPQTLQGCYVYRNQRLIDYGKEGAWKGAYGSMNPKTTLLRWEVNLPCHRLLGKLEHSDWKIDTSKSQAVPTSEMQARFKNLASKTAVQRWHRLDPNYKMAPGPRATARRGATGNGTKAHPWDRWPICKLCTDKTEGWTHKKAEHKCSFCGKKGHEKPFFNDGTPNKKCGSYVERPPQTPVDDTGGTSEGEDDDAPSTTGSNNGAETPIISTPPSGKSVLIKIDSESNDPISSSKQDGIRIVTINKQHIQYPELMEQLTPLVRSWEEENIVDEEE